MPMPTLSGGLVIERCGNRACCRVLEPLLHCSGCKIEVYCSKECQKIHWKVHKTICRVDTKGARAAGMDPSEFNLLHKWSETFQRSIVSSATMSFPLPSTERFAFENVLDIRVARAPPGSKIHASPHANAFVVLSAGFVKSATLAEDFPAEAEDHRRAQMRGASGAFLVRLTSAHAVLTRTMVVEPNEMHEVYRASLTGSDTDWLDVMKREINEGKSMSEAVTEARMEHPSMTALKETLGQAEFEQFANTFQALQDAVAASMAVASPAEQQRILAAQLNPR